MFRPSTLTFERVDGTFCGEHYVFNPRDPICAQGLEFDSIKRLAQMLQCLLGVPYFRVSESLDPEEIRADPFDYHRSIAESLRMSGAVSPLPFNSRITTRVFPPDFRLRRINLMASSLSHGKMTH